MITPYTVVWLNKKLGEKLRREGSKITLLAESIGFNPETQWSRSLPRTYGDLPTRIYSVTDTHIGSVAITYAVDSNQHTVHILIICQNDIELKG